MNLRVEPRRDFVSLDVNALGDFIARIQKKSGEIPWSEGGKTDPWDHVESAMGLTVAGRYDEAARAYSWMAATQLADGSWWSAMKDGQVEDWSRESNFSSYISVGVFHFFLTTGDREFVREMWPTVEAAIDFAVGMQAPTGEVYWAKNREGVIDQMALLTGSSSIYMSLKCALAIASLLGEPREDWRDALGRLGEAIRNLPNHFNMIKSRFSMDWYYPILSGAISGDAARQRISRHWDKFAVPDWGIRCVSDRPWVTMAETSELILALVAIDAYEEAEKVFGWLRDKHYDDGSYWMGVTFPDRVIWPEEKTAWTTAAVLLAYDALNGLTLGSRLFKHSFWDSFWPGFQKYFRKEFREARGKDSFSLVERFKTLYR